MHSDPQSHAHSGHSHPGGVRNVAAPLEATATMPLVPGGHAPGGLAGSPSADVMVTLPRGVAMLVVAHGPNAGARFLLDRDITTAGRHADSDIFLDDITVSRQHAQFQRTDGAFAIVDSGSLNGVYVNRQRMQSAALRDGDEVQIGKFRLVFHAG